MEKTEKMMSAEEFEQNIAIYEQMVKDEQKAAVTLQNRFKSLSRKKDKIRK